MSEDAEKKKDSTAKWAAEVDACIRLFESRGASWWGLLLVQLGWGTLAILCAQFFRKGESDFVFIKAPFPLTKEFDLRDLYLWGAISVAFFWLILTDSFTIPLLFIRRSRFALIWLLTKPLWWLAILITVPFELFGAPFERRRFVRWKAGFPEEKRKIIEEQSEEIQKSWFYERGGFKADWLWDSVSGFLLTLVRSLASRAVVGIAPASSLNLQESEQAARDQGAGMANGFGRIRRRLQRVRALQHLNFVTLPTSCQVTREDRAVRLQRHLGLEVFLWGPYVTAGSSMRQLNFVLPLPLRKSSVADSVERRVVYERNPFDNSLPIEHASVLVDEKNSLDCYMTAILTILLVFEVRRTLFSNDSRAAVKKTTASERAWADTIRYADPFYMADRDEEELMLHLGFDVLPKLPAIPDSDVLGTNASLIQVLIELISRWNGGQLDAIKSAGRDEKAFCRTMARLAALIAERIPNDPRIQYRRAAWACVCGNESETRSALSRAVELERDVEWFGDIYISISASLLNLDSTLYEKAKSLCHATRALLVGGERVRKSLQSTWRETFTYKYEIAPKFKEGATIDSHDIDILLVDRLLHELIMNDSTIADSV